MAAMVVLGDMLNVAADGEQGTDGWLTFLAIHLVPLAASSVGGLRPSLSGAILT